MGSTFDYIRSDLYRHTADTSAGVMLRHLLLNRSFKYMFWFRLCRAPNPVVRAVARVMHWRLSRRYGIQIPARTRIGYGFYIGHYMSIVVNHTTVIGNNCNISQFTTIGSNSDRAAHIGDNVYIGPGVSIVEDVRIGDNAAIGAGSVVTRDVPADSTAVGSPAVSRPRRRPGEFVNNRWPVGNAVPPADPAASMAQGVAAAAPGAPAAAAIAGHDAARHTEAADATVA